MEMGPVGISRGDEMGKRRKGPWLPPGAWPHWPHWNRHDPFTDPGVWRPSQPEGQGAPTPVTLLLVQSVLGKE